MRSVVVGGGVSLGLVVAVVAEAAEPAEPTPCRARPVSPFWQGLDALCARGLPAADPAAADAAEAPALAEARAYCASKGRPDAQAPAFAALAEAQRMAELEAIVSATGQAIDLRQTELPVVASPILNALAQRIAPDAQLQTGVATDLLVRELQKRVCAEASVQKWLPNVCGPLPAKGALIELRTRIVRDSLLLAVRAAHEVPSQPSQSEDLRLLAALVAAAVHSVDPYDLAVRLTDALPIGTGEAVPCPAGSAPIVLLTGTGDPLKIAARVIGAIALDGSDYSRPPEHYARLVARVLGEERVLPPNQPLTPQQAQTVQQLVTALGSARTLGQRFDQAPNDNGLIRPFLTDWAVVVEQAMTLATGRSFQLPAGWLPVVEALVAADLPQVAERLSELAPDTSPVPSKVIQAVGFTVEFVTAPTDAERRRILRRYLLGLPPWTETILFDVNLGTVIVDVADLNAEFAGDLALGYNAGLGGGIVRGSAYGYEYTEAGVSSSNTYRVGIDVEGWLSPGTDRIKADLRLKAGYAHFDTDVAGEAAGADLFSDETSDTGRATLLAGVRYTPTSRFAVGAWAGGGGQFEEFNSLVVNGAGDAFIDDGQKLTGKADARLRMQATLWPRVLVGRLRADVEWFKLSTTSFVIDATASTVTPETAEVSQTEIELRAYLDLEAARFAGFVPSLSGGLNLLAVSASGGIEESTAVPVFAAGIRRDVF